MRFSTGSIFYNDVEGLARLMPTIQDFDYNIFIDGSWPDWGNSDISNDGSRAIIASWEKSRIIDMPQRMPRDKYDKILRECELLGVDYLVVIDSDEYVKHPFDYEKFKQELESIPKNFKAQSFRVTMEYFDLTWQKHLPHYRIIYHPGLCHYGERHNQLWCEDRELFSQWSGDIESFIFVHDKRYKTPEYIELRRKWNLDHPTH